MANILCVLYDDPVDGYPPAYARDDVPKIESYYDGQTTPTPEAIDFTPGELLGSVSGELGLRKFLEDRGHKLIVTSDKDGPDSVFERELPDAEVVISQPFWPAYLTAERIAKAPKLKLALTAGQRERDRAADAAGGARHEGDAARHASGHGVRRASASGRRVRARAAARPPPSPRRVGAPATPSGRRTPADSRRARAHRGQRHPRKAPSA